MADSKVFLNDPNLMTDLNPSEQSLGENVFTTDTDNLQMIDNFLNNASVNSEPSTDTLGDQLNDSLADPLGDMQPQKEIEKENCNSNSNDEQHVESPTATGEGFAFKCIYCDRTLAPTDNPKLLECLHNSCTNCINGKLFENNESSGSAGEFLSINIFKSTVCKF